MVCPIYNKDWYKTDNTFEKRLKQKGIRKEHIALLSDVLDDNYNLISNLFSSAAESNGNGNGNGKAKSKLKSKSEEEQSQQPAEHKIFISFEQWQSKLIEKYNTLQKTVQEKMPHLWASLEFGLSIKSILHIKEITLPFAGIILGPPSSDKTYVLKLLRIQEIHIIRKGSHREH